VYFAGGLAKEVDDGVLVFVVFCLHYSLDRSIGRNSTANADSRVEIPHKSAKGAIINNIKRIIADDNELNQ
jgi:hypothetical protein